MTERQLRTDYFSNSHLLHLIFQAPGGWPGPAPKNWASHGPGSWGLVYLCPALALARVGPSCGQSRKTRKLFKYYLHSRTHGYVIGLHLVIHTCPHYCSQNSSRNFKQSSSFRIERIRFNHKFLTAIWACPNLSIPGWTPYKHWIAHLEAPDLISHHHVCKNRLKQTSVMNYAS